MYKNFVTPKGRAAWPKIARPDPKYGNFNTQLVMSEKEGAALYEMAKDFFVDEYGLKKAEKATLPIKKDEDGTYVLKVSSKKAPKLVDRLGQMIPKAQAEEMRIGSGTVMKLKGAFKIKNDGSGVTAYFDAVQIIELVEFGSDAGFGVEEGSFEAAAAEAFAEPEAEKAEDVDF